MPIQGDAKPGVSTAHALDAMERIAAKALPDGMTYAWTDIAFAASSLAWGGCSGETRRRLRRERARPGAER